MLTGSVVFVASGGGVTVGAHRYYAHRAFKATFGLQCWLMALFTIAGQVRTGKQIQYLAELLL
jgi:fatty-acid desaturase